MHLSIAAFDASASVNYMIILIENYDAVFNYKLKRAITKRQRNNERRYNAFSYFLLNMNY